jgi:hypothetical protein
MTGKRKAEIATAALVIALGVAFVLRARASGAPPVDPQGTIYAMLDAARAGDAGVYVAAFTGQMEATLRRALSETTVPGFAKYLRDSNAAIKGIAVSDPQRMTDREVKVRVEYVYQDRNNAQTMYLEKGRDGWKISRVDNDEAVRTLIPYGTRVK